MSVKKTVLKYISLTLGFYNAPLVNVALYEPNAQSRRMGIGHYYAEDRHRSGCGPWFHAQGRIDPPTNYVLTGADSFLVSGQVNTYSSNAVADGRGTSPVVIYHNGVDVYLIRATNYRYHAHDSLQVRKYVYKGTVETAQGKMFTYAQHVAYVKYPDYKSTYPTSRPYDEVLRMGLAIEFDDAPNNIVGGINVGEATWQEPDEWHPDFQKGELDAYRWYQEIGIFPNWYSSGLAAAYVDMLDDMPMLASNSIANVLEIKDALVGVILNLLQGNLAQAAIQAVKEFKDPRNAYLAWHYSYRTSKSDILEIQDLVTRLDGLDTYMGFHIHGTHVDGGNVFRSNAWLVPATDSGILPDTSTLKGFFDKWGLKMNAERFWDLIPYSFIIDWFFHISNYLHHYETLGSDPIDFKTVNVWTSVLTRYDDQEVYFRQKLRNGDLTYVYPAAKPRKVSDKTLFMRIADTISIFSK